MSIEDFDYVLPPELVGQEAIEPRDSCRLLALDKNTAKISLGVFTDLLDILDNNTCLVINDTKVFPARLYGRKLSGGAIEILLLKHANLNSFTAIGRGSIKVGNKLVFGENLEAKVDSKSDSGELVLKFNQDAPELLQTIDTLGNTPLPPYIHSKVSEETLRSQYQTVYAQNRGSAAAPTAGLHFTDKLLSDLINKGVQVERVTLHVGLGTFKNVTDEQIQSKTLHSEQVLLDEATANRLNEAKRKGKKIIAVGTTTLRLLESLSGNSGQLVSGETETNIFIQPGYKYKFVDGLITNFHLPKTSLLMLVCALVSAPNTDHCFSTFSESSVGRAYQKAIDEKMKFFSFGDAMLIT